MTKGIKEKQPESEEDRKTQTEEDAVKSRRRQSPPHQAGRPQDTPAVLPPRFQTLGPELREDKFVLFVSCKHPS